jgi:hypothetical protein
LNEELWRYLVSRYLLLVLLNLPFIIAGILNAIVSYKMKRISKRKYIFRTLLWIIILLGLLFAETIYKFLFSNNLTQTEPLSLFDVIQITGIILAFFIANQAYSKVAFLEKRVQDLHQELSIRLTDKK